jgi:hypothetical protein
VAEVMSRSGPGWFPSGQKSPDQVEHRQLRAVLTIFENWLALTSKLCGKPTACLILLLLIDTVATHGACRLREPRRLPRPLVQVCA